MLFVPAAAELTVTLDGGVSGMTSNSVIDIEHDSSSVWIGTGGGAAVTTDNGASWTTYGDETLPSGEVSGLAVNGRGVWVGNSHTQAAAGESFPYGDGISLSRDGGLTWSTFLPEQSQFFRQAVVRSLAVRFDRLFGQLLWRLDSHHRFRRHMAKSISPLSSTAATPIRSTITIRPIPTRA